MPYIEEKELLNLHLQLEKNKQENTLLLDKINLKNKGLQRVILTKRLYLFTTVICMAAIGGLVVTYYKYPEYILGDHLMEYFKEVRKTQLLTEENKQLKESLAQSQVNLKKMEEYIASSMTKIEEAEIEKQKTENLPSFKEDFNAFFQGKTLYSVQIGLFKTHNLLPYSKGFQNFRGHKKNSMYSYSIGNFLTKEEAENFKRAIIKLGFKDAYIVTFRNGKEE